MQLEAFEDPPLVIETFNFTDYFTLLFELLSREILLALIVVYNGDISGERVLKESIACTFTLYILDLRSLTECEKSSERRNNEK